jgi:multidrug efflux pump
MNISSPFIRRSVATTLLTAAVALAGIVAYRQLPVSPLPQVDFPTISVQSSLPGASPEIMASSVAAPLERQLGHIAGLNEMTSASYFGVTSITLQFNLDRNIDGAARDVQAAINAARANLPANLPSNPSYRKVNPADAPIMILALTSDVYDRGQMYDVASTVIQQRLLRIPGVGQVNVGGSSLPAVRVDVSPAQLNSLGLSLEDVRTMLGRQNADLPKGQLSDQFTTADIHANDQLFKADDYKPLIVAYKNGSAISLSDIANVEDSVENIRNSGFVDGKQSVSLILFRQPGANIIDTVENIKVALPALKASIPAAMTLTTVLDRTTTIRASVYEVQRTLLISILLVILVVFLFLRNFRATLIPAVVVPVSLIGSFAVMYLFGYSVDNLSLMALTISTGFVVDDAIVVIENIARHLEEGLTPMEAAFKGAREVGFTVLSISASLIAVFIPILLMGGIVGRLFREFAVVLSTAIVVSLVVSLTTTPMMCSRLLRRQKDAKHGRLYRASERVFDWTLSHYERSLALVLRHPAITLIILLLTIGLNVYLFKIVPKGFFPQQDNGTIYGGIQGPQDASFNTMRNAADHLVNAIKGDPAIAHVTAFTGGNGAGNTGFLYLSLKPLEERKTNAMEIINRLRPKLNSIPGVNAFVQAGQDIRIGGRGSAAQYQYTIESEDLADLVEWGPKLLQEMRKLKGFTDVNSDQQNNSLQVTLVYDRPTAARLGLSPQVIDNTLYDAFGQRQVSTTFMPLNQYHVVMEVDPRFWQSPEGLNSIYLHPTNGGPMVPLSAIAHYQPSTAPISVNHQSQFPSVTLSFNLQPGLALSDAVDRIQDLEQRMGMPARIHGSYSGTLQAFRESLATAPMLIITALAAVYIVLGILYESLVHPITILSTLPSAGVGACLALLLFKEDLSVIAIIGILLLIGIVKKNAIMMIDFALAAERDEGRDSKDAIYQACILRFRPILMTTLAAMFGALPLALGNGVGSEMRKPLGITIVGGLIMSQILTLYTTPVVYLYIDRIRLWVNRKLAGRRRPTLAAAARQTAGIMIALASIAFLTGCNFAPKYTKPTVETAPQFKEFTPDQTNRLSTWKPAQPSETAPRGKWWELFGDEQLNQLESQIDATNQTIAAAVARVEAARAIAQQTRAGLFPLVALDPAVSRSHQRLRTQVSTTTVAPNSTDFTQYSLPVTASWEPDLWGRIRNAARAGRLEAEATQSDLENVRLSVHAELAVDYFQIRSLDAQKQILEDAVAAYKESLDLAQARYETGIASDQDVAQAQTQLTTTRAEATDLGVQRAQLEHAIAVILGHPPANFGIQPAKYEAMTPSAPLAVPSELLQRRPDIAAAERRVMEANANIGAARAAYFPTITLSGSTGFQSTSLSDLATWPSFVWSVGGSLSETIFDAGRRKGATREAWANYNETVANYRETALTSFKEVEDSLAALRIYASELEDEKAAVVASRRYLALANDRYKLGIDSYLNVIVAQTSLLNNERTSTNLQYQQAVATINFIKALGGSWTTQQAAER